jgi:hypothetical protein
MNSKGIWPVNFSQLLRLNYLSFAVALIFLTFSIDTSGQEPKASSWPTLPGVVINYPTPLSELKRYVVFIVVTYRDGQNISKSEGTGFFVAVPDKRLGEDGGFSYFVTNRHMADPSILVGHPVEILNFSIVANQILPSGDSGQQRIEVQIQNPRWVFPQDSSIDLAVVPLGLDHKKFDFLTFPETMFVTKDIVQSLRISEGDSVIFTGFFAQFPGRRKIEPIVRQGILAMMPEEEIPTTLKIPGHLYLADLHSFHGNSGSPVFINLSERPGPGGSRILTGDSLQSPYALLGVVSGYMYENADMQLQVASTFYGNVGANSGITTIVPADELKKILDGSDLSRQRNEIIAAQPIHKQ